MATVVMFGGEGFAPPLQGEDLLLTFSHSYRKAGKFTGTVTVRDADGTVARQTFSVEVVAPESGSVVIVLLAFSLAAGVFATGLVFYRVKILPDLLK